MINREEFNKLKNLIYRDREIMTERSGFKWLANIESDIAFNNNGSIYNILSRDRVANKTTYMFEDKNTSIESIVHITYKPLESPVLNAYLGQNIGLAASSPEELIVQLQFLIEAKRSLNSAGYEMNPSEVYWTGLENFEYKSRDVKLESGDDLVKVLDDLSFALLM